MTLDDDPYISGMPRRKQYIPTLAQVAYHGHYESSPIIADVIEDIRPHTRHHSHSDPAPLMRCGYSKIVPYAHLWRCVVWGCGYSIIRLCNTFVERREKCKCEVPVLIWPKPEVDTNEENG